MTFRIMECMKSKVEMRHVAQHPLILTPPPGPALRELCKTLEWGREMETSIPRRLHSYGRKWSKWTRYNTTGEKWDPSRPNKRGGGSQGRRRRSGKYIPPPPHVRRKRETARRTVAECVVTLESYCRRESGGAGRVGFAAEKHTSQHIMGGRLAVCVGRGNEWARANDSLRAVVSRR